MPVDAAEATAAPLEGGRTWTVAEAVADPPYESVTVTTHVTV